MSLAVYASAVAIYTLSLHTVAYTPRKLVRPSRQDNNSLTKCTWEARRHGFLRFQAVATSAL